MSNQRLMKAKEKAGDGYAKTNAIGGGGRVQGRVPRWPIPVRSARRGQPGGDSA